MVAGQYRAIWSYMLVGASHLANQARLVCLVTKPRSMTCPSLNELLIFILAYKSLRAKYLLIDYMRWPAIKGMWRLEISQFLSNSSLTNFPWFPM